MTIRQTSKAKTILLSGLIQALMTNHSTASAANTPHPPASATPAATANPLTNRLLQDARLWVSKYRDDLAQQMLEKVLLMAPAHPEANLMMLELAWRRNDPELAEATLAPLQARLPNTPWVLALTRLHQLHRQDREQLARMRLLAKAGRIAEAQKLAHTLFAGARPVGALGDEYDRLMGTPVASASTAPAKPRKPSPVSTTPNAPEPTAPPAPSPESLAQPLIAKGQAALEAQQLSVALRHFEDAMALTPADPWLRLDVAKIYLQMGAQDVATEVMNAAPAQATNVADAHHAVALYWQRLEDDARALPHWQAALQLAPQNAAYTTGVAQASARLAQRDADQATALAKQSLTQAMAQANPDVAWTALREHLQSRPLPDDLWWPYARLMRDHPTPNAPLAWADVFAHMAPQVDDFRGLQDMWRAMTQARIGELLAQDRMTDAQTLARAAFPWQGMARLPDAKAPPDDALRAALWQAIDQALDEQALRQQGEWRMGLERLHRRGTDGESTLIGWEAPISVDLPQGNRAQRIRIHTDPVWLTAQATPPQWAQAHGLNVGVVVESPTTTWDVGQIGLGFARTTTVGGVSWPAQLGTTPVRLGLSRRPLTGSVLSYGGMTDAATGHTWGGVVANGAEASVSGRIGKVDWRQTLDAAVITGHGVDTNQRVRWQGNLAWDAVPLPMGRLQVNLSASVWRYNKDLGGYTPGQGGYYSPQSYVSLAIPVVWEGEDGPWSWRIRTSLATSRSRTDTNGVRGDPSTSSGHSMRGQLEYQVNPAWSIGTQWGWERSPDYAPTQLMVYLRHHFGPRLPATPTNRPRPAERYSQR